MEGKDLFILGSIFYYNLSPVLDLNVSGEETAPAGVHQEQEGERDGGVRSEPAPASV